MLRALAGSGSVTTRGIPPSKVLENTPDEARCVTSSDEPRLANEKVNATPAAVGVVTRLLVRSGRGRMMGIVHLQIARVAAVYGEDEALNGGFAQMLGDRAQGYLRVWPPARDVRLGEPAAHDSEAGGSHPTPAVLDRHQCRRALSLGHVLLSSASSTTLVLV